MDEQDLSMGLHTNERPFCDENDCPCHEDADNMETLEGWYNNGLVGVTDAVIIFTGRTV